MDLNATLLFQSVAFLLFVAFTWKYVWPPILKAMNERQARIADGLAAAEKGARALQDASAKSDEALKEARVQAQEIIAAANRTAAGMVEQAKTTAQAEGERILAKANEDVQREVEHARAALREKVGELALTGAAKILKREVDAQAHADILGELAAKV